MKMHTKQMRFLKFIHAEKNTWFASLTLSEHLQRPNTGYGQSYVVGNAFQQW